MSEAEIAARTFYRLGGWEKYWPYEAMPGWLRPSFRYRGALPGVEIGFAAHVQAEREWRERQ